MVPASERESSFRNIPCYAYLQLPRSQALETLALDRTSPLCPTVQLLSDYRGSNFLMVTQPRVFSYWRQLDCKYSIYKLNNK
jgi:hypothetical protein